MVANESLVRTHKLENQATEMVAIGIGLVTDFPYAFAGRSAMDSVGYGMTCRMVDKEFASVGANRDDVGMNELHDCFAANEVQYMSCCPQEKRMLTSLSSSEHIQHLGCAPSKTRIVLSSAGQY
jgi:hypothetical protein